MYLNAIKNDALLLGNEILKAVALNGELFTIGNLSPDAYDCSPHGVSDSHFKTAYKPGVDKYSVVVLEELRANTWRKLLMISPWGILPENKVFP